MATVTHSVALTIAGVDRTCDADDTIVLSFGRDRVTVQPDPAHCAAVIGGPVRATIGDDLTVDVTLNGITRRRFTGTITDLDAAVAADGTTTRIVAVSAGLGIMARRIIGDTPWPQELAGPRIGRILTAAGVTPDTIDPGAVQLLARDVDARAALGLAQAAAGDALGVLVDTVDGTVGFHDWTRRRDSAAAGADVTLTACDVLEPAQAWQRIGDLVNTARVRYGPASPQAETSADDPESVARFGAFEASLSTQLAAAGDAATVAGRLVALYGMPAWTAPTWTVPIDQLPPAQASAVVALDVSDRVDLVDVPPPLVGTVATFVEGWTDTITPTVWDRTLQLSDLRLTTPVQRWVDVDPGVRWVDVDPGLSWTDAYGTPVT